MQLNNYEIRVLVKGRPINEYSHNGQTFIEGREGSNFEIEFKNLTGERVEAVLAVDGLSIIDGKEAGPTSSGYVVEARETIRIPGWKLSDEAVASFVFAGKKASYAAQSTGSARNTGVLGAMVFKAKPKQNEWRNILRSQPIPYTMHIGSAIGVGGLIGGAAGMAGEHRSHTMGAAAGSVLTESVAMAANMSSVMDAPYNPTSMMDDYFFTNSAEAKGSKLTELPTVEQTLGTGFGDAQEFSTTTVQFERGDLGAMIVVYYDDARGLKARGIELNRKKQPRVEIQPQAFPGMSCKPPEGWNG